MWLAHQVYHWIGHVISARIPSGRETDYAGQLLHAMWQEGPSHPQFDLIERYRDRLLNDKSALNGMDYGAGMKAIPAPVSRSVRSFVKLAVSPPGKCRAHYRMVSFLKPRTIIELGSGTGINAAYLSLAHPTAKVYSLEGNNQLAGMASELCEMFSAKNVEIVEGTFDDTLPGLLENLGTVDLAFIDGNHRYEATVRYFDWISRRMSEGVIVIDDIRWSRGMWEAWKSIAIDNRVSVAIDCFTYGILLCDQKKHGPARHVRAKRSIFRPFGY